MNVLQQCCKPMVLPKIHSHMDKSNTGTQSLQTLSRRVITQNAICILSTKKKKNAAGGYRKKKKMASHLHQTNRALKKQASSAFMVCHLLKSIRRSKHI